MTDIKKILCAVDLSDHSGQVAAYAKSLAEKYEAKIICVYVAPTLSQYVGFQVPPSSIESFVGEIVTGADQSMQTFVEENFSGLTVEGKVVTGYAAEEILAVAETEKVDLLVMGTHGRRGLDRMLFGSVAEKLVKSCACPVLTVRPAD